MSNKRTPRSVSPLGSWHQVPVPPTIGGDVRCFQKDVEDGHLSVFSGPEPPGWHLSISHRSNLLGPMGRHATTRYPSWDEIADARYQFAPPNVTMAMLLPPKEQYVNIHETTFHLWQVPAEMEEYGVVT